MTITLAVCLKAAWRTDVVLRLADSGKAVRPDGSQPGLSPVDLGVLAHGCDLKKVLQGAGRHTRLVAVTVGSPVSDAILRDALAAGADEVVRIWPAPWPRDSSTELDGSTLGTRTKALLVADTLRPSSLSGELLVLTGEASSDEGHAAFGAYLAQALHLDFAHRATRLVPVDSGWLALVKLERGYSQELPLGSSAVVTLAHPGLRLAQASWPAWLASRSAVIPLDAREIPPRSGTVPVTVLRTPIPRVKRYRVPDSALPAEARIRALVGSKPQGNGTVIPASEGFERQVDAIASLLKSRGYLPDPP